MKNSFFFSLVKQAISSFPLFKNMLIKILIFGFLLTFFPQCASTKRSINLLPADQNVTIVIRTNKNLIEDQNAIAFVKYLNLLLSKYPNKIQVIDFDDMKTVPKFPIISAEIVMTALRVEKTSNIFEGYFLQSSSDPNQQYENLRRYLGDYEAHYGIRVFSQFTKKLKTFSYGDFLKFLRIEY